MKELDSDQTGTVRRRNKTVVTPKMAMESFRFSFLNNEENQDINFDAILGELCELETQLSTTQSELSNNLKFPPGMVSVAREETKDGGSDTIQAELDALAAEITQGLGCSRITHYNLHGNMSSRECYDAGETDSAFSDNASLPSSESFTSMATVSSSTDTTSSSSGDTCSTMSYVPVQSEEEQKARLKAEKIRIALEKIKEAKIRKLFVRVFAEDGSSKSILVDEKMTVGQVTGVLADKNHICLNSNLAVIEHMPDLFMERILEDHDSLVENMVMWTRDSKNKILFEERQQKYDLFKQPEKYLLHGSTSEKSVSLASGQRDRLLQEFYSRGGSHAPEVEGMLYLKADGKKSWKKYFFVLRASGLYYNPKGKISKASKDLVCLVQFDFVEVYHGLNWKKKYHSPTDFTFALKHPQIQKKTSKYIRYFCAETDHCLDRWITGIRMAKFDKQLQTNYDKLLLDISTWDEREETNNQLSEILDQPLLKNLGNLQDSQMSIPEPGSRHSIITVVNASLVRDSSGSDSPKDVVGFDATPVPQRKGSASASSESPQHKAPVKRVSFSNTHSVINPTTNEEMLTPLRHRDSITSASTDSSEDSTSSGEGRHGFAPRSKIRAKLPVTTETTRQLSEMFSASVDSPTGECNFSEENRRSVIMNNSERRRSASSLTERRGSSDSGHSRDRRGSFGKGHSSSSHYSSTSSRHSNSSDVNHYAAIQQPALKAGQSFYTAGHLSNGGSVDEDLYQQVYEDPFPPPPVENPEELYTQVVKSQAPPPAVPATHMKPPPPKPPIKPPCAPPAPPSQHTPQEENPYQASGYQQSQHFQYPTEQPQSPGYSPQEAGYPQHLPQNIQQQNHANLQHQLQQDHHHASQSPPPGSPIAKAASQNLPQTRPPCANVPPQPPSAAGKPPLKVNGNAPPPPPVKTPAMAPPAPPVVASSPSAPPVAPKPQSNSSPLNTMQKSQNGPPTPPAVKPKPMSSPLSPQLSRGPEGPSRNQTNNSAAQKPPAVAPKGPIKIPKPAPLSVANGNHAGPKMNGSPVLRNGPQSPAYNRAQASPKAPTSPCEQKPPKISHVKYPSTGSQYITNNNNSGPKSPTSPNQLPFLSELNKNSQNRTQGNNSSTADVSHAVQQSPNTRNHRRSASAGNAVVKQKDGKKAPPPPKRSQHTRLSSDSSREIKLEPQVIDPIYENCEGIMDINDLPLPPPELLDNYQNPLDLKMATNGNKVKPPPPPPKRNRETQLTPQ
ncbi:ras-associated and pleckstrin homology domains-containing protein 1 isoform X3 [Patella vulgata]|uniref:ras-associated and pleckstrin homology domains-containing protein 1 isoform X3 n=1 Tax=Patella vulgata TaxID=6465 RepID=UPI00217F2CCC|nr:ras-associated and pleckstrin homology domains-containing protein 1 isoform X3 [Patella vulgata]